MMQPLVRLNGLVSRCSHWRLASSSSSTEEDRYIQSSNVASMHFQPGLMRLAIPKLKDTCARYLAAVEPVAPSKEAFTNTQKLVEEFQRAGGIGEGKSLVIISSLS